MAKSHRGSNMRLAPGIALACLLAFGAPTAALAIGDPAMEQKPAESAKQPETKPAAATSAPATKCGPGTYYNASCSACASTCETGKSWDCAKKECVAKSSGLSGDGLLYRQAAALIKDQNYREARALLLRIEERNRPEVLNYIGYTTRKLGDVEAGIGFYHKALALDPDYHKAREYLGEGYLQKGDVNGAKGQLMEIASRCGTACEEYGLLANAITLYLSGEPLPKTW